MRSTTAVVLHLGSRRLYADDKGVTFAALLEC